VSDITHDVCYHPIMDNDTIMSEGPSMAPLLGSVREWLVEKRDKGVRQVRITSVIDRLPPGDDTLVGTAEAAVILNVERPRIAKWRRNGIIPEPLADTAMGPIWLRSQIESVLPEAEARRRTRRPADAAA
jgi:hypothetical protein